MKTHIHSAMALTALFALAACQSGPGQTAAPDKSTTSASPVVAHGASARDRELFIQQHEASQANQLTLEEYKAFREKRFSTGDVGGKGYLTEDNYVDEYAARLEQQLEQERKAHIEQTKARFGSLDKDKDGFISRAEYQASGDRLFAHLDKEGRGVIEESASETTRAPANRSMLAMPTSHSVKGFLEIYDEDADGRVTRAEFDQQRGAAFEETDSDGDGRLSFAEYLEEFSARLDRQAESVRQRQLRQAGVRFGVIDTSKDKRIDREEYWAVGQRTFEFWDTNNDGVVNDADALPQPRQGRRTGGAAAATATAIDSNRQSENR